MNVCFIVGPTGCGKSELAMRLASENRGAIINCDSIQVYQGLKIGSALPSESDFKKVPHFLFAYVPKGKKITAGQFSRDFYSIMENIEKKFANVYVVGGTGFYFQAIEKGMFPVHAVNEKTRNELELEIKNPQGLEKIYRELTTKDPQTAKKISIHDHYRLVRAVELMRTEGKSITQIKEEFARQERKFPWPLKKIGIQISRAELEPFVAARTEKMLRNGLVQEVQSLLEEGLQDWDALKSVGYKETLEFLQSPANERQLSSLKEKIITGTLQLAKKQRTWFKRDPEIEWRKAAIVSSTEV